jgi:hypothetical protein
MKRQYLASTLIIAAGLTLIPSSTVMAQDDWHFGLGTGFFGLNIKGDTGFTTAIGPVDLDTDLNTSEVSDLLDSAAGLGGYAAKGKWVLGYSVSQLKLEGTVAGTGPLGNPASALASFEFMGAEFTAARRFALKGKHAFSVLGGVRHSKHEYNFGLAIDNNPPNPPATFNRDIDQDWTDVLVGLTHGTRLSDKWTWGNRIDAGFGGSEGTYFLKTSFGWEFANHWALHLYAQDTSIEYENDNRGDPDWYLYDADEFGAGVNVLYTW